MKLYLDLENTLIDEWGSNKLLLDKIAIIKAFIKQHSLKRATIFSFALTNSKDLTYFNKNIKKELESILSISIDVVIIEDIFETIMSKFGIKARFYEFHDIYLFKNQKTDMFKHYVEKCFDDIENETFVLFDDTVNETTILLNKTYTKIVFKEI